MNMTQARRKILQALLDADGTIMGAALGGPGKVNASKMQRAGLVEWESPKERTGNSDLRDWKLHLTDKGRKVLLD